MTIDNNIRMLAELHARWEREEKEAKIAKISNVANVCTIYTNEDIKILNAQESSIAPKYANGKIIRVGKISTMPKKNPKLSVNTETVVDFKLPSPIVLGRPFLRTVGAVIDMRVVLNFNSH